MSVDGRSAILHGFLLLLPCWTRHVELMVFAVQKADDATAYSTCKQVEDTCRAMMTSYTSDSLIYQQYKDSENAEKLSWAEQAKMRANKTAASYNEYVLKTLLSGTATFQQTSARRFRIWTKGG